MLVDNQLLIIQARIGSSRFPRKVIKPFFKNDTILDIIIKNALKHYPSTNIYLATSKAKGNEELTIFKRKYGINIFFGSENDVLSRFSNIVKSNELDALARICADNPFIDFKLNLDLLHHKEEYDYMSYCVKGTPAILTHYGFFYEYVSKNAILYADSHAEKSTYREHVTNYIYLNPHLFNLKFVEVPPMFYKVPDLRLTIDDIDDFKNAQSIYQEMALKYQYFSFREIIDFLSKDSKAFQTMKKQIKKYSKV